MAKLRPRRERILPKLLLLAAAVPPAGLALLVYFWGVDLPYWDQWALVPMLEEDAAGSLELRDLWRQHNEHRPFFPRLVMIALARLSGWNILWELTANMLLAAVSLTTAVWMFRRHDAPRALSLAAFASLLIFNPSQWENWSWGWAMQIFLNAAAVLAGLGLLAYGRRGTAQLLAAAALGLVATFSFANGLFFWLVAYPLVLLPREARRARGAGWTAMTLAVWGLYFHHLEVAAAPGLSVDLETLKLYGGYVSLYIGAPLFFWNGYLALYGGFLALVAFAAVGLLALRRSAWRPALPWICVSLYAIASAVVTAAGRLDFGLLQALSSRYVTISYLFWLGFVGLVATLPGRAPRRALRLALVAGTLCLLLSARHGALGFRAQWELKSELRAALRAGVSRDFTVLLPRARVLEQRLAVLRRLELSCFRDVGAGLNGPGLVELLDLLADPRKGLGDVLEDLPLELQQLALLDGGDGGGAGVAGEDRGDAEDLPFLEHGDLIVVAPLVPPVDPGDAAGEDEQALSRLALAEDDRPRFLDQQAETADQGRQLALGEVAEERRPVEVGSLRRLVEPYLREQDLRGAEDLCRPSFGARRRNGGRRQRCRGYRLWDHRRWLDAGRWLRRDRGRWRRRGRAGVRALHLQQRIEHLGGLRRLGVDALDLLEHRDRLGQEALVGVLVDQAVEDLDRPLFAAVARQDIGQELAQMGALGIGRQLALQLLDRLPVLVAGDQLIDVSRSQPAQHRSFLRRLSGPVDVQLLHQPPDPGEGADDVVKRLLVELEQLALVHRDDGGVARRAG